MGTEQVRAHTRPSPGSQAGRPLWVSIEGINGVGKTTAAQAASQALGERCLLLDELTDQGQDTLPGRVIAALSAEGDACLRTGHPVVETLALMALKAREVERFTDGYPLGLEAIIEDRGLDSVAVCQAAIMAAHYGQDDPQRLAHYVLWTARQWMGLPDLTILLTGERTECVRRLAARIGRRLTPSEQGVIYQTGDLYQALAAQEPDRYTVVDTTGWPVHETARAVEQTVREHLTDRGCTHVA